MIIEIALGIVLAVLILMFFDVILAFGAIALGIAVAVAVVGVVVYFAFTEPAGAAFLAVLVALIGGTLYWDSKRQGSKSVPWPIAIKQAATILLLVLAVLAGWLIYVSTSEQLFAVAVSVACAAVLFSPLLVLDWIRARKKKTPIASP